MRYLEVCMQGAEHSYEIPGAESKQYAEYAEYFSAWSSECMTKCGRELRFIVVLVSCC